MQQKEEAVTKTGLNDATGRHIDEMTIGHPRVNLQVDLDPTHRYFTFKTLDPDPYG